MAKFPVPDEERLQHLIFDAHEYMPGPDMAHLTRIEQRLSRHLKTGKSASGLNKTPWWVVLLLAGGLATAAWWAAERGTEKGHSPPVEKDKVSDDIKASGRDTDTSSGAAEQSGEQGPHEEDDSPVIYRREAQ